MIYEAQKILISAGKFDNGDWSWDVVVSDADIVKSMNEHGAKGWSTVAIERREKTVTLFMQREKRAVSEADG